MISLIVVVLLGGAAAGVAAVLRRRTTVTPQQGPTWEVPIQVDRADFDRPDADWLVVLFSSSTCLACAGTWSKVELLGSPAVAVQQVDAVADEDLHDRYRIDAVPMVVIADREGVVRRHFLGEPTATDLWAALAGLRDPASVPDGCSGGSGGPCGSADAGSSTAAVSDDAVPTTMSETAVWPTTGTR